jgi:hypothetical protein
MAAEKILNLVADNLQAAKGKELESRVISCCQDFSDIACIAENGSEQPGDFIIRLYLDKRDTKRINLKIVLSTTYKYIITAVGPYEGNDKLCSIIFSDYAQVLVVKRNRSKFTLTD